MDGWTGEQVDEWIDGWMDEQVLGRQTKGQKDRYVLILFHFFIEPSFAFKSSKRLYFYL